MAPSRQCRYRSPTSGDLRFLHLLSLLGLLLLLALSVATAPSSAARRLADDDDAGDDDADGFPDGVRCNASAEAAAALQALPAGILTATETWGYVFRVQDVLSVPPPVSGGVRTLDRGTIFVPHKRVAPLAYAPYAIGELSVSSVGWGHRARLLVCKLLAMSDCFLLHTHIMYLTASAGRARFTVIAPSTNEAAVEAVIAANPSILTWALVAHGVKAGRVASKVAEKESSVTALALVASKVPPGVDLSDSNLGVYLYYGAADTRVPRSSLAAFAARIPCM